MLTKTITTYWYYLQFILFRRTEINLSTVFHKCDFPACMCFLLLFLIVMKMCQRRVKLERFNSDGEISTFSVLLARAMGRTDGVAQ